MKKRKASPAGKAHVERFVVIALDQNGQTYRFRADGSEMIEFASCHEHFGTRLDRMTALSIMTSARRDTEYRFTDIRDVLLEVEYIVDRETQSHYKTFHFVDGKELVRKVALNRVIAIIPEYTDAFIRIKSNCILNLNFLDVTKCAWDSSAHSYIAVTVSGMSFVVGRLYQAAFRNALERLGKDGSADACETE